MKKCMSCQATKGLKTIWVEDCDCHFDSLYKPDNHWICMSCYFETCACGQDMHSVNDCLKDKTCENHEKSKKYFENWDQYDIHWELKKKAMSPEEVKKYYKNYYQKHKAELNSAAKKWKKDNYKSWIKSNKKWHKNHPEYNARKSKEWRANNPERTAKYYTDKKAKKKS